MLTTGHSICLPEQLIVILHNFSRGTFQIGVGGRRAVFPVSLTFPSLVWWKFFSFLQIQCAHIKPEPANSYLCNQQGTLSFSGTTNKSEDVQYWPHCVWVTSLLVILLCNIHWPRFSDRTSDFGCLRFWMPDLRPLKRTWFSQRECLVLSLTIGPL